MSKYVSMYVCMYVWTAHLKRINQCSFWFLAGTHGHW